MVLKKIYFIETIVMLTIFLSLLVFFVNSQIIGGITWDEASYLSLVNILKNYDTTSYQKNGEIFYYGVLPILPTIISTMIFGDFKFYNEILHFSAFLYFIGSCIILRFIIQKNYNFSKLNTFFLIIFYINIPSLIGHSFFNFKDFPLLFFYLLAVHSLNYIKFENKKNTNIFFILISFSFYGCLVTKFASIVFFLPFVVYFFFEFSKIKKKDFILYKLFYFLIVTTLFVILSYPQSWNNPFIFFYENIMFFANHPWNHCYIIYGECAKNMYSITYILKVFFLKLPFYIIIFNIIGIFAIFFFKNIFSIFERRLFVVLYFPLVLISIKNSTLYDGLRHLLFLIPIMYLIFVMILQKITKKIKLKYLMICIIFFNLVILGDNIKLFPYNYIYVNELNRKNLSETYQTNDYWGFSLKETSAKLNEIVKNNQFNNYNIIANPIHLITPFIEQKSFIKNDNFIYHKSYTISYSRNINLNTIDCKVIYKNFRKILFASENINLSFICIR
jgi:hypothetical protein